MIRLDVLDVVLAVGVILLGGFLAVYFKQKYKVSKRDFLLASLFVAALTAIIIGVYHMLRASLALTS